MISSANITKALPTQTSFDKENNARNANITSQGDRNNLYSRKVKKLQEVSINKPSGAILENIEALRTANPLPNLAAKPSIAHKQEEIDISRKLNANRVKKALNFDEAEDMSTMCDESNYSSVYSVSAVPNKPQDDKMSLEKDKTSAMQVEKEPKRGFAEASNKMIEEESTKSASPKLSDKESPARNYQNKMLEKYADCILQTFKEKDEKWTPRASLKNHKIPSNLRAKMVDWMVEVLTSYKCSEQTFFIALNVMDLFFERTTVVHDVSDLHLVGVTSMFIASKYEEIYPLRLSVVHEKIAHRKLSMEAIKKKEKEILDALEYKVTGVTPYDFMMIALFQMDLRDVLSEKLDDYLLKVCTYLSKMTMHDYDLISQQGYSELAASTVFVAFKIIEQLDKSFPLAEKVKQLRELLEVDEEVMFDCATRILSMAKNFEKIYPNLENLKKFNSFSLDGTTFGSK